MFVDNIALNKPVKGVERSLAHKASYAVDENNYSYYEDTSPQFRYLIVNLLAHWLIMDIRVVHPWYYWGGDPKLVQRKTGDRYMGTINYTSSNQPCRVSNNAAKVTPSLAL